MQLVGPLRWLYNFFSSNLLSYYLSNVLKRFFSNFIFTLIAHRKGYPTFNNSLLRWYNVVSSLSSICVILFQNILFWECQRYKYDKDWDNNQLAKRVTSMTESLLHGIKNNYISSYICPEINVLRVKNKQALSQAERNIENFLCNPLQCLQEINMPTNHADGLGQA